MILQVTVIQVAVAQSDRLYMWSGIMAIDTSQRKGFLINLRQIPQNVFGILTFDVKIQFHAVDTSQAEQGKFIPIVETGFQLKRSIRISRKQRQAQNLEKHLQIRLTDRYQIGGFVAQMSVGSK